MTLTGTPAAERVHIAFFGRRNAGKSSLINTLTGQGVSLVSEVAGTTTDPVMKTMELLPLRPVVLIDTPGIDDTGALGTMRVRRARQVLNKTDIAVLVVAAAPGDHRLPGLRRGEPPYPRNSSADLLFHPHGALQGPVA